MHMIPFKAKSQVVADYPALAMFYDYETITSDRVTCSVSGVITGPATGGITHNADGTVTLTAANAYVSGTIPSPGTKHILVMQVGKPSSAAGLVAFRAGSITAAANIGFSLASGTTSYPTICDGTTKVATTQALGVGDGAFRGMAATFELGAASNGIRGYTCNGASPTSVTATPPNGDLSAITTIGTVEAIMVNGTANVLPSLSQVWYFTTMPTVDEVKAALAWTYQYATATSYEKKIYPGFKGRS